jgi:hypothetical protein
MFIKNIKRLFDLLNNFEQIKQTIIENKKDLFNLYDLLSKNLENKIERMTFDYTKNLDGTKSDYLKRYIEVRLNCIEQSTNKLILDGLGDIETLIKNHKEESDKIILKLLKTKENKKKKEKEKKK